MSSECDTNTRWFVALVTHSNLDLVVRAIKANWDVDLDINTREDILLDGFYKVCF
jgi:hypothetical protein